MRATTVDKTTAKEEPKVSSRTRLLVVTFRVAVILTLLVVVAIGAWAVFALVGGTISAGDPFSMIAEWFKAVTGG